MNSSFRFNESATPTHFKFGRPSQPQPQATQGASRPEQSSVFRSKRPISTVSRVHNQQSGIYRTTTVAPMQSVDQDKALNEVTQRIALPKSGPHDDWCLTSDGTLVEFDPLSDSLHRSMLLPGQLRGKELTAICL